MGYRSDSRIVRGWRVCAVLGITLLVGIGAYADSVRKAGPAGKRRVALLSAEGRTGQYKVAPALTTPAPQSGLRQASGNNPACGAGAGSCCPSGNGTPGCDDEDCCNCICDCDAFCCDDTWDDLCAGQGLDGGPCGASNPNGACTAECSECIPECGNDIAEPGEQCDGLDDDLCPGECQVDCTCPGCEPECPGGAADEGEPCGEDTNGGCNSDPPVFVEAECNMSFCGIGWADGGTRDTDWYLVNVAAGTLLTGTVISAFPSTVFILDGVPDCPAAVIGTTGCGDVCTNLEVASFDPPGGQFAVFVGPGDCDGGGIFDGFPCGGGNNGYVLEIACEVAVGACCDPAGKAGGCDEAQTQEGCEGQPGGGTWLGGAGADTNCLHCVCLDAENECLDGKSGGVGCNDLNCCVIVCQNDPFCCENEWDDACVDNAVTNCPFPPDNDNCVDSLPIFLGDTDYDTTDANTDGIAHGLDCALEGQTFHDIWYDHVATCDGILRVTTCPGLDGAASYDTHLVVYTGCLVADCPPGQEDFLGCNDDGPVDDCPGFQSFLEVPVVEGQCYKLRVGGFADGDEGVGRLHLECNPPPDPTGACCLTALGENCDILTAAGCGKVGGDYLGDDEVCSFIEGEQVFEVTGLNLILLDGGGPVSDTITVEGDTVIFDVDVGLSITHSWVGDLRVTLEHNGTTVVLISQPGDPDDLPGGDFGCPDDNYDNIILDDQGIGGNIEDVCEFNLTSPPNYVPFEALAAFNGMSKGGDWTLTAEDVEPIGEDEGRFTGWSLHIEGDGQEISNCDGGGGCGDCPPDQGGTPGEVDPVDLAGLLGCWGPDLLPGCECYDTDGQNGINPVDLATLLGSWGVCPLP